MLISGWGRFPVINTRVHTPDSIESAAIVISQTGALSFRGNGRGYGDCSLNNSAMVSALGLNLFECFDEDSGVLVAGAGVLLSDIVDSFMPRGWFLSVSPGTCFVSLGGAVACDVHGKDHHVSGSFINSVEFIDVITPDHGLLRASPDEHADLFYATFGGMGLTGMIVRVAIRLKRIYGTSVNQVTTRCANLKEIMECFEHGPSWTYSVAWIDCLQRSQRHLGRSLFMGGEFADEGRETGAGLSFSRKKKLSVPFDFPGFALNSMSVRMFNSLYFNRITLRQKRALVSWESFFYPLDAIENWNRIYGARGFTQYQFVIPKEDAEYRLSAILKTIASSGQGSFLTVLKLFGGSNNPGASRAAYDSKVHWDDYEQRNGGMLSFPQEGYTLALDFAIRPDLFALLEELDQMVEQCGGRLYLAKDSRMSERTFQSMYSGHVEHFLKVKKRYDHAGRINTLQSQRLGLAI